MKRNLLPEFYSAQTIALSWVFALISPLVAAIGGRSNNYGMLFFGLITLLLPIATIIGSLKAKQLSKLDIFIQTILPSLFLLASITFTIYLIRIGEF